MNAVKSPPRLRYCALILFGFVSMAWGRVCLAEGTPGIAQEKPEKGPWVKVEQGYMVPYTETIPGTNATFEMIPIPGGKFTMGSPDDEEDRRDDEGPQFDVIVEPFWMGKYEVTWSEYREYMKLVDIIIDFASHSMRPVTENNMWDAVTVPSNLYDPTMTFKNGEDPAQPAVTMTTFGAKQYTKFLSKLTGRQYRLPAEAEWEYACRGGTDTAYSFGNDVDDLNDYAWNFDNAQKTEKVGGLKPNPFGLYDMHGNASELVLDAYDPEWYEQFDGKTVKAWDTIKWPTEYKWPDARVHRGGSYRDFEDACRSAARRGTEIPEKRGDEASWKKEDPNEPKSPWWFADKPSLAVGMRIIRPLKTMSKEELEKSWHAALEEIQEATDLRMNEGRGAVGIVDPDLPDAIKELQKKRSGG